MRGQKLHSFNRNKKGFDKVPHPFLIKEKTQLGACPDGGGGQVPEKREGVGEGRMSRA